MIIRTTLVARNKSKKTTSSISQWITVEPSQIATFVVQPHQVGSSTTGAVGSTTAPASSIEAGTPVRILEYPLFLFLICTRPSRSTLHRRWKCRVEISNETDENTTRNEKNVTSAHPHIWAPKISKKKLMLAFEMRSSVLTMKHEAGRRGASEVDAGLILKVTGTTRR
jgi:hypothetical protein